MPETKSITILCTDNIHDMMVTSVEAETNGPFGFHETIPANYYIDDYRYTITHVPTGYACLYARTKANARKVIAALNKLNWTEYEVGGPAPRGYYQMVLDLADAEIIPMPLPDRLEEIQEMAAKDA